MKEESIRALLKRTAHPAIFLHRSGLPVPMDHPAHSYLGGLPKLPPHVEWPHLKSAEHPTVPLHFIAQIDLSELPKFKKNPLPRSGTLYFFICAGEILGWLNGSESKVLYYEGSATAACPRAAL